MSKILETGGAGFIGSNFARYWLEKHPDDQLVILDKFTYAGHRSSITDCLENPKCTLIEGDIVDPKVVDEAMKGVDVVVHFAAESHVDRSIIKGGALEFLKTNVDGTGVLLDAAAEHKVKRFHHVSTDEVFGDLPIDTEEKFTEETPYNPHSPYAASKAASDHVVRAYFHTWGLPITITNCSNNYGPYQDPEKFLPRMITTLIDGGKVPVYGDGTNVRDWLYVDDHCRAIEAVLLKGKVGETYCVGGQTKDTNNLEITKMVLDIVGKGQDQFEFVTDRKGHDRKYAVDWTKINRELGWKPQYEIEQWLEKTVKWYQDNQDWWRPLKKRAESIYKPSLRSSQAAGLKK